MASPSRLRSGIVLSILVALAAVLLPFRITPRGIDPNPGSAAVTGPVEPMALHESVSTETPAEHRDGSHPHQEHCFWCIVLIGPIATPTRVERVQAFSPGAPTGASGVVRLHGLDLAFAPRAPPPPGDLPL